MLFYYLLFLLKYLSAQCNKQFCALSDQDSLVNYQLWDSFDKGMFFWYKYHVEVQTQSSIIIFQESIDQETPEFSYIIGLNNSIATHELESFNRTVWDNQLIVPLAEDEHLWHLVFFYKDDENFMHIQIQVGQNLYHGLNRYNFPLLAEFKFNNHHPRIYVMICAKEFIDISLFPKIKDSICNDDFTTDIQLTYYWHLNTIRSQSFNLNKASISGWFRDYQLGSKFQLTIQQFFLNQVPDSILSINKQGNQFFSINTFGWDSSSNFKNLTLTQTQALLSWYYIELNPFSHFKLHTLSEEHTMEITIIKTYPTAQLYINLTETIFANLTISANIRYECSPACESCSSIMTCIKCKSNRILPYCECPQGLYDFGEIDCLCISNINLVQNHQGLTQINTIDENCPVGYQQCENKVLCDHGYIQYNKKCYQWYKLYIQQSPKLGDEICQYCVLNSELLQPTFFCKYTSNDNLLRFKKHTYDEYMISFRQNLVLDIETQYYQLDLASVVINYVIEDNEIKKQKSQQSNYFDLMDQGQINYQCPYGYQIFTPYYSAALTIEFACLKIPKGCLKIEFISLGPQCKVCKPSYSLVDNLCQKCPKNCLSCNQNHCTSCIENFYRALDGRCKLCTIQNCKICYEFQDGYFSLNEDLNYSDVDTYCALCQESYQFNYQRLKCELAQNNGCQVSIYNHTQQCLVFQHSQSDVLSSACYQKECAQCYKNRCLVCIPGYYLQNSLCKICRFPWMYDYFNDVTIVNFDLNCQLIDPFNHSEFKYNLQHIFLLHSQKQADLIPLQIRIDGCLSVPIIYDVFYCQTNDNQRINDESQLCQKYYLTDSYQQYCIQQNQNYDGLVIDRKTGKVRYCGAYKACLIKIIYEVLSNPKQFVEYQNMTYQDINEFARSINYVSLQKQEVDQVEIIFNLKRTDLGIIKVEAPLSINLILNIEYPKDQEIYNGISEVVLSKFDQILIERFDGQYKNTIMCNNLKITWFVFGPRKYVNSLNIFTRQTIIFAKDVNISYVYLSSFEINNQQTLLIFDQTKRLFIKQLVITDFQCENSQLFLFNNLPSQYFDIIIDELKISKSYFKSCNFFRYFKGQFCTTQVKHITINSTTFVDSDFFQFWNLSSQNIAIMDTQIVRSVLFHIYLTNEIDYFYIANSTLNNSTLIMNQFTLDIKQFQSSIITTIYSQLITFMGYYFEINILYLLDTDSKASVKYKNSLIFIESDICMIGEVSFKSCNGNVPQLRIKSKEIKISSVIIIDDGLSIAQVNDQCQIILNDQQSKTYLILEEFNYLEVNNTFVSKVQSNEQIIQITSSLASKAILYNATFSDIYVLNGKMILIDCSEVSLNSIVFNRIWFHDLIYNPLQIYMLVSINSISLVIQEFYFVGIKNINSNQFRFVYIQSVNIKLNSIYFIQQQFNVSQYIKHELNKQQREYLDHSFGNSQLLYIISKDIEIQGLIIRSIPKSTQYLIYIDNNTPILKLLLSNWTVSIGPSRKSYYLGLLYVNQIIQQGIFSNLLFFNIQVLKNIFEVAINDSLIIQNLDIRNLLQGSVLYCQLIDNQSSINIFNSTIETKIEPNANLYQSPILFQIINGNVSIRQIVLIKQLANTIDIQKAYSIKLNHIYILLLQPISNLILISSLNCQYLELSHLYISHISIYQTNIQILTFVDYANVLYDTRMCWNGSLSKESTYTQFNLQSLIIFNISVPDQSIIVFRNTTIKKCKNIDNLLLMPNRIQINLDQIQFIENSCEFCIKLQDNQYAQRILRLQSKYQLNFTQCSFIQNQGVLFDFQNTILNLHSSQIIHKKQLQTSSQQYTNEFIFQQSNVLYNSSYSFHSHFALIDSYLINQQSLHILNTNAIQIALSLDDGFRTYPSINNTVVFNDRLGQKYDYFHFPTGQELGSYQRISFQDLKYRDFIQNMKFVLLGKQQLSNSSCSFLYLDQNIIFDFENQNWKPLKIIDKPGTTINLTTQCDKITLRFKVKLLHCQIGEIFVDNQCLRCNSKDQYQVHRYATTCITKTSSMKSVQSGLIELEAGYWRPHFFNDQVEICQSQRCLGGWDVGDKSCQIGYIGALCSECDLYQLRSSAKYIKNSFNNCTKCQTQKTDVILVTLLILLNCILLFKNVLNWQYNCVQRRNTQLFQKQFLILQKFQVDQISIIAFLFNNFIQIFLMINQSNLELPLILKSTLMTYSNPNISLQEEFKCIISEYVSQEYLIVGKPFIFLLLQIIFFNFFLCLFIILTKRYKFKILLIILYYIVIPDYSNYFEILIQQSTWQKISGIKWLSAHLSLVFNNQRQQINLYLIILPQIVITFLVLPIVMFKYLTICKIRLSELRIYYKIGYFYSLFKDSQYHELILILWQKMIILWIVYFFQNEIMPKILLLLLFLTLFEKLSDFLEPFTLHKFNNLSKQLSQQLRINIILFGLLNYCNQSKDQVIIIQLLILLSLIYSFNLLSKYLLAYLMSLYIFILQKINNAQIKLIKQYTSTFLDKRTNKSQSLKERFDKIKIKNIKSQMLSQRQIQFPQIVNNSSQQSISQALQVANIVTSIQFVTEQVESPVTSQNIQDIRSDVL